MAVVNLPDYTLDAQQVPVYETAELDIGAREILKEQILNKLQALNATLIAHYYVDGDVQDIAELSGGFVSDSLEMARFGRDADSDTLIVAGVRFMGETAKILSPHKRVYMPTMEAECSLDLGCPPDEFAQFKAQHADRTVVVYANTSARVKALADWVVTSSCALDIVNHLKAQGEKFFGHQINIWAAILRNRPVLICCCGAAPVWSMKSLNPSL